MDNLRSAEIFVKMSYGDIMFFKRVNGKSQRKKRRIYKLNLDQLN